MLAIDLGSNSLRILEYDCETKSYLRSHEKVVKTADKLLLEGLINDATVCRVINAIQSMQMDINFEGHSVYAVTTEAMRRAKNSKDVLKEIFDVTGVLFEIISGEEEARLTLLAVKQRLTYLYQPTDNFVLVDIGGGSTELIFNYANKTITKSFPIGIVTLAQSYDTLEDIQKALPKKMLEIEAFCTQMYATKGRSKAFIATAGTPTTVVAMKLGQNYADYDASKVSGSTLLKDELTFYLNTLLEMPFEAREIAVGTGRSDLIAAGILIYRHLYTLLKFETCIVIDDGLREGVALDFLSKKHSDSIENLELSHFKVSLANIAL